MAFVQQMTLWFLPYLTLLAQAPFVTDNKRGDLIVSILTLGTPMLALYSLFISLFHWMWIQDLSTQNLVPNPAKGTPSLAKRLPDILATIPHDRSRL
jgi:hypothetical protein